MIRPGEKCLRIVDWWISRSDPVYLNSSDINFRTRKKQLEDKGYSGREIRGDKYIFNKANAVMMTLVDDNKRTYGPVNLHDLILNYFRMQRLSEKKIFEFQKAVNTGIVKLVSNGRTYRIDEG